MTCRVSKGKILSALVSKQLFSAEDNIAIECEGISAISYKDLVELYLKISQVGTWHWVDALERIEQPQPFLASLSNILRDILTWSFIYLKHSKIVSQLLNQSKIFPEIKDDKIACLFLRTDHWFNVKSGGSVGHISGVVNSLRSLGYQVPIVSTDYLISIQDDSWFNLCEPSYKIGRNLPQIPELLYNQQLFKWIDEKWLSWSPSFIYQRYSLGNYVGVLLKQKYQVPYICEYNGSFAWMSRNWGRGRLLHENLINQIEQLNLQIADVVVVVSNPMKDELIARGIEADKILVNPNCVDPNKYSPHLDPSPIRNRYNLNEKTVIGFIGIFGKWHGAEVLATAFGQLLQEFPSYRKQVRLLLIGDGLTMPLVREQLAKFEVMDACILPGLVPQDEGPAHLAACDIVVCPHIPNPDGTPFFGSPTKLFEYMAMGKGIVASDLDQIGEVLEHNHTAWMVKPGNAKSLMIGLKTLIDDEQLRNRLGQAARQEVVAKYTWQEHTRKIIERLKERCG